MIVETGARRRTFNLLGFAKNIMSYEAYGSPAAPVNFQRAMESNSTQMQTLAGASGPPGSCRSFIHLALALSKIGRKPRLICGLRVSQPLVAVEKV